MFRHGETDWNVERRFQGHTDTDLNENGLKQAKELSKVISNLEIELVLSSDLKRAADTARIAFNKLNIPIYTYAELRETQLGDCEGQLVSDIITKYGEATWNQWISSAEENLDFAFPNGETKRAQLNRVCRFLEAKLPSLGATKVAVATHGGVLRRLIHHCQPSLTEPASIANCLVHKIILENNKWSYHGIYTN